MQTPTKKLVDTSFEERGRKGTPAPTGVLFSIAVSVPDGKGGKQEPAAPRTAEHEAAHTRETPRENLAEKNFTTVQQREVWPRRFADPSQPRVSDSDKTYLMTISHHASPPPPPRLCPAAAAPDPAAPARQPPPLKGASAPNIEPTLRGPNFPREHRSKTPAGSEHPPPPPRPEPPPNAARRPPPGPARPAPLLPAPPGPAAAPLPGHVTRPPRSSLWPPGGAPERRREPPGPARPRLAAAAAAVSATRGRRCRRPPPRGPVGSPLAQAAGPGGAGPGRACPPGARRIPAAVRDTARAGSTARRSTRGPRCDGRRESGAARPRGWRTEYTQPHAHG